MKFVTHQTTLHLSFKIEVLRPPVETTDQFWTEDLIMIEKYDRCLQR